MWELLVIGIDPGTKVGYAVLGLDGRVRGLASSKQMSLSSIVAHVLGYGIPVVVGSDKAVAPAMVKRFSAVTGARVIVPKTDLKPEEKQGLTVAVRHKNAHERDALAAAIYAFRKSKPLLHRLAKSTEGIADTRVKQRVFMQILREGRINIAEQIRINMLREPPKHNKSISLKPSAPTKPSRARLYKREIELLREQNNALKLRCSQLRLKLRNMKRKSQSELDGMIAKHVLEKQEQLKALKRQHSGLKRRINLLECQLWEGIGFVARLGKGTVLLKHLPNLRWSTFITLNRRLRIEEGDILLVDNPNEYNKKTLSHLNARVIVYRQPPLQPLPANKLLFIGPLKHCVAEWQGFVLVQRAELDNLSAKGRILDQILKQYRHEREEALAKGTH